MKRAEVDAMSDRYVLTARLMFTDRDAAQRAADRIEAARGAATATEYVIDDVS